MWEAFHDNDGRGLPAPHDNGHRRNDPRHVLPRFAIMGWSFRRSINLGPFRINLSKSGVGYSVGAGGVRVGKSARGRTYRSFSVPGTGVSYRTSGDGGKGQRKTGCLGFGMLFLAAGGVLWSMWSR